MYYLLAASVVTDLDSLNFMISKDKGATSQIALIGAIFWGYLCSIAYMIDTVLLVKTGFKDIDNDDDDIGYDPDNDRAAIHPGLTEIDI